MPCSPGMTKCAAGCLHRRHVRAYQQERQRQDDVAMERAHGYGTEYAEYVEQHPLITFKQWLVHTKGWSGRKEVDDAEVHEGTTAQQAR